MNIQYQDMKNNYQAEKDGYQMERETHQKEEIKHRKENIKFLKEEIKLNELKKIPQEWKQHYLAQLWKENNTTLYNAMEKAINFGLVDYTDRFFNFKCAVGCVGLFFAEAGYTDYKFIKSYIKINNKEPAKTSLENCKKNVHPSEWKKLKESIFTPEKPVK